MNYTYGSSPMNYTTFTYDSTAPMNYTFDDFLLEPQYSDIDSRSEVNLRTVLAGMQMNVPVIPANMDSIVSERFAEVCADMGQVVIYHRYMNQRLLERTALRAFGIPSVGVKSADLETAVDLYEAGYRSVCVDVAHGHQKQVGTMLERLRALGFREIIAGNIATAAGAKFLVDHGATVVKTGVGCGARCSTRSITGHGVPQMSAILNAAEGIRESSNPDATLIADGGVKYIGDIAKALAAGADYVMSGYLFAGCTETPNPTNYRGMASKDVQEQYRGSVSNSTPEGVSLDVEPKGSVREVYEQIAGGLRSALAYSGCADLQEFKENAILNIVSSHTHLENGVRK